MSIEGIESLDIVGAEFWRNEAVVGGAVFQIALEDNRRIFGSCLFEHNKATDGGALYFATGRGVDRVVNSVFNRNHASETLTSRSCLVAPSLMFVFISHDPIYCHVLLRWFEAYGNRQRYLVDILASIMSFSRVFIAFKHIRSTDIISRLVNVRYQFRCVLQCRWRFPPDTFSD